MFNSVLNSASKLETSGESSSYICQHITEYGIECGLKIVIKFFHISFGPVTLFMYISVYKQAGRVSGGIEIYKTGPSIADTMLVDF